MKTTLDKVKEWVIIGLLCSTLLTAGWALKDIQVLKKAAVEGQKFQKTQGELNVGYELVFDFVLDDIKEKRKDDEDQNP